MSSTMSRSRYATRVLAQPQIDSQQRFETPAALQAMRNCSVAQQASQSVLDLGLAACKTLASAVTRTRLRTIAAGSSKRPRQESYGRVGSEGQPAQRQRCKGEAWPLAEPWGAPRRPHRSQALPNTGGNRSPQPNAQRASGAAPATMHQRMASHASKGRRLSVAAITGGRTADGQETLESRIRRERVEKRQQALPNRVAKRRQTQLTLVKPKRDGRVATGNAEAVVRDEIVVRIETCSQTNLYWS